MLIALGAQRARTAADGEVAVTVSEGTSMAVAVSPDGRTLAIDLQGSIWTLPSTGGAATRITDLFDDARQPVWAPDGKSIVFFAFRDGGYDLWSIAPDGGQQRKLTWGPYDDREPAFSHDGTRIAFSSDRVDAGAPAGSGNYNIWTLDLRSGELRQLTRHPAEDTMPAWSPDDTEIAFASTREESAGVWAVRVADGAERKAASSTAKVDAAGWSPDGRLLAHATQAAQGGRAATSHLEVNGTPFSGDENVFPFRVSWASATEFYYTADGKIRKRAVDAGAGAAAAPGAAAGASASAAPKTIEFTATLQVTPARYTHRIRDVDSIAPRKALGIVRPVLSPDGRAIAFAAVGDIYVLPIGGSGKPENLTKDAALDTEPAWSPDGSRLVYSSDKGGGLLQLWVRDLKTGQDRQLTSLTTQPMGATWSPDGTRIAFLEVDGVWRRASVSVVDVASGKVTKIHDSLFGPGTPTWSPDGARVAIAMVWPFSTRFREGTNQILTIAADGSGARGMSGAGGATGTSGTSGDAWYAPVPNLSIDSRGGCGPVWSPDGTKMAAIYEGVLTVIPVSRAGAPIGPPRRITTEIAHAPSWAGDSRTLLYQSNDRLVTIDVESGERRDVPLDLTYTPAVPKTHLLVHAGHLVDGKSQTARAEVDILIDGNRIRAIEPHAASRHASAAAAGTTLIDASSLTAMPGLIEFHSHLQKDFGEAQGRAWLAFGITTVRSPGSTPYEAVEDREANEAGVRPGPRVFGTGYLMEWQRVYYKMGVAISGPGQLEMELQRAKVLQHDLIKSYVRMPDLQQRRMVAFAHGIGVPVATHEIYPSAFVGVDNTEHTSATSRRGYSPKMTTLQRSYQDVIQIFGKSGTYLTPTVFGASRKLLEREPALAADPRLGLYPAWLRETTAAPAAPATLALLGSAENIGRMIVDVRKAGGRIVAGTDTPNGLNLHAELLSYVQAGLTPFEALQAATVTPAGALGLDAGSLEPGKLADIALVEGNPLEDIAAAHKVKRVIANGRVFAIDDLLRGAAPAAAAPRSSTGQR
jgi:Tol biopolymer transport system component